MRAWLDPEKRRGTIPPTNPQDASLNVDVPESDYGKLATLDGAVDYLAGRLGAS